MFYVEKKSFLLPTAWKPSVSQSLIIRGLDAYIDTIAFKSLNWRWMFCCSTPALCFPQNQSDVNRCLYLEHGPFHRDYMRQPLNIWAQWCLYLPCSLSGDQVGVRLLWVRPLCGPWPIYFFFYWGCCGEQAQSESCKQKGRTRVVEWASFSLPVNLYNLFSVCLSENSCIF